MSFDPKKHTIRVQGNREYLPVSARLVWFRQDHPDWGIITEAVEIDLEKKYAIFKTTVMNEVGRIMATATKMEDVKGFADFVEKAETGSVGRALAYCGYGTQFAPELEEGRRVVDAPQGLQNPGAAPGRYVNPQAPVRPPMGMGTGTVPPPPPMNGNMNAPGAPQPPAPAQARPAPMNGSSQPAPMRPAPAPPTQMKPPPTGAPITRVRETAPDVNLDPAGEGDDDEFYEEELDEMPLPTVPRPTVPPSTAPKNSDNPVITSTRCAAEGCPAVLTQSQITVSTNKFGRPLCPLHQQNAAPLAASGAPANGQPRRSNPL